MALPTSIPTYKSWNFLRHDIPRNHIKPSYYCTPIQQQQVESGIMCVSCNGSGWLQCDFCRGQKTNVKSETNRIYRRCPNCKATGWIMCSACKVYRCVTFPDDNDEQMLSI